jgi:hypothetical protein
VRAEQRWVGLASGILSRAVRFLSSLLISTACLRELGAEAWGTVAIALAATDLVLFADFAVPELCAYEAARANDPGQLRQQMGQALWLAVPPAVLGTLLLFAAGQLAPLWSRSASAQLTQLMTASACGYALALLANCYAATLQGLGHLREMNTMHALSGLLELGVVITLLARGGDALDLQWARSGAQLLRIACFLLPFVRLRLEIPRPLVPRREPLRAMARYCLGNSTTRLLGGAIYRVNVPVAQAFTSMSVLGAYDAVDRLGTVLQRAANPVWDSLFQRLVRSFQPAASELQREAGRRDFFAGALLLAGLSAGATVCTVNLAPWLFPIWLGDELARRPVEFAPWVMATWSLNLSTSMCTAVLTAHAQFKACNWVHAAALATTVGTIVLLGRHDGTLGLLAGPALGNAALALGLSVAACRSAQVRWTAYVGQLAALWLPASVALAVVRLYPSVWVASVASALGCLGIALSTLRAAPVRSLARDFASR